MNRRAFAERLFAAGLGGFVGMATNCSHAPVTPAPPAEPQPNPVSVDPKKSGIDHIVVVTMENRSFDHFLGWMPGAAGIPAGLSYADKAGNSHPVYPLGGDYTGCGHPVPDNSYGRPNQIAYDGGKMDGFLRVPGNDMYAIGYYTAVHIPFLAALAQSYTVCDHWFAPILAETFPNRMFLWCAQTDRLGNSLALSGLATIFDRLAKAGISHRYYFGNVPFLALWGLKYVEVAADFDDFLHDAAAGKLPAAAFVDPKFTEFDDGLGNDDHPHSDIRNGDAFLASVFRAVSTGPQWPSTVLIVIFDEWGGFFDHIAPPRVIAPNNVDQDLVDGKALLGFRVPAVIASPFTRGNHLVDSTQYDHTAVLKLIEWRWGLEPLTLRDATADIGNPVARFRLSLPDATVPSLPQPGTVAARVCSFEAMAKRGEASQAAPATEFQGLGQLPAVRDWLSRPQFKKLLKR